MKTFFTLFLFIASNSFAHIYVGTKENNCFVAKHSQINIDTNIVLKTYSPSYPTVYTNLLINTGSSYVLTDGVATTYNNKFSSAIDGEDAGKVWNYYDGIAEMRNDQMLSIEFRPVPKLTDTIFYKLYLRQMPYALQVYGQNIPLAVNAKAWLVDRYLNTRIAVGLHDTIVYDFIPNTDTASYSNRFMLVFNRQLITIAQSAILLSNQSDVTHNSLTGISIYPNPATSGNAYLRLCNTDNGDYTISIFNENGHKISFSKFHYDGGNNSYRLPFNAITQNGLYHINIVLNNKKTIILPVVVNK